MTPDQAMAALTKMRSRLIRHLREAETKSLREGKKIAMNLSSGTITTAQLARMGHPYAATHSRLPQNPEIINRQSGLFRRSWRTKLGSISADKITSEIWNETPYAVYLEYGTSRMVARFVLATVTKRLKPIQVFNAQQAIQKTLAFK